MAGFHDYTHAPGVEDVGKRRGNFPGQPLLHLKPPGEHVHDPGHLAYADDPAVGNVAHVTAAEKGEQVVLAHAEEFDVPHDDHVIGLRFEKRAVDHRFQVLGVAPGEKLPAAVHPSGGLFQPLPFRIFTDLQQKLPHQIFHRKNSFRFVQMNLPAYFSQASART